MARVGIYKRGGSTDEKSMFMKILVFFFISSLTLREEMWAKLDTYKRGGSTYSISGDFTNQLVSKIPQMSRMNV